MKKRLGMILLGMGLLFTACSQEEAQEVKDSTDVNQSMAQDIGDAATVETNPNLTLWSAPMEEFRSALILELGDLYRLDSAVTKQDLQNEYQVDPAWITDYMGETAQNGETLILIQPNQEDEGRVLEALQESLANPQNTSPDENDEAPQAQIVRIGRTICYVRLGENNSVVIAALEALVGDGS
ncbi:MAG: DUF4358 domain-containing protein [Clostridium sp.]|jgi:hypothetical protein|nr:DUF4358 domain-containing protein [Clostridium sp.]